MLKPRIVWMQTKIGEIAGGVGDKVKTADYTYVFDLRRDLSLDLFHVEKASEGLDLVHVLAPDGGKDDDFRILVILSECL